MRFDFSYGGRVEGAAGPFLAASSDAAPQAAPDAFELVRASVRYAAGASPYYQRTLGDCPIESWADFRRLPIIDRAVLAANASEMRVPGVPVHYVTTTTGTTSRGGERAKAPVLLFRSEGERRAAHELLRHQMASGFDPRGLVLRLMAGGHGQDLAAGISGLMTVPCSEPHHLAVIAALLRERFDWNGVERRVSVVTGSHFLLKCLTLGLISRGWRPADFGIACLVSKGGLLTRRWQRVLSRLWRAPVLDVYGVSEVPGFNGALCPACGGFRPSGTAVVEFLALDGGEEVERGLARLVATAFYPLAEVTPMIRYDTGDIAYLEPGRRPGCGRCFTLVGRRRDLVPIPDRTGESAFFSPMRAVDILDSAAGMARELEQPLAGEFAVRADIGNPLVAIEAELEQSGRAVVTVRAETRAGRAAAPLDRTALAERLRAAIFPKAARTAATLRLELVPGNAAAG